MVVEWVKLSEAIGSGTADPNTGAAAAQPIPSPSIGNKPAPGRKGPSGTSPRTSYAQPHTVAPPSPDAGAAGQKSMQPRGMEFLPAKVAQQEKISMSTTMIATPDLHDLVKEAMEGTASKVDISAEAARQLANVGQELPEHTKTASVEEASEHLPTEYIYKLAGALDHMAKVADEGTTKIQPGKGPNALEVLEATSTEENIDAGGMGEAKTKIPVSPAMTSSGVAKDSSNAMDENSEMSHPEQPVDPMHNEKTSAVQALYARNLEALGLDKVAVKGTGKAYLTGGAIGMAANEKAQKAGYDEPGQAALRGSGGANLGAAAGGAAGLGAGVLATDKGARKALKNKGLEAAKAAKGKAQEAGKKLTATKAGGKLVDAVSKAGKKLAPHAAKAGKALKKHAPMAGLMAGGALGGVAGYKALTKKYDKPKGKEASASLYARNLMSLGLFKQAEDALAPASISSGSTQTGATPPEGASPSEESVPSEPSDVTSQKSMLSSNQAAIDYKKVKAKADPKKDMGHLLSEPALTASTDATLKKTLDHTSEAGAKIAADLMKTAAAQAILSKLADDAAEDKKKGKKEKNSMLNDPAGQSGFSASNTGPQQV